MINTKLQADVSLALRSIKTVNGKTVSLALSQLKLFGMHIKYTSLH